MARTISHKQEKSFKYNIPTSTIENKINQTTIQKKQIQKRKQKRGKSATQEDIGSKVEEMGGGAKKRGTRILVTNPQAAVRTQGLSRPTWHSSHSSIALGFGSLH